MWWLESPQTPACPHIWCGDGRVITAARFAARKALSRISRRRNTPPAGRCPRWARRPCSAARVLPPTAGPAGRRPSRCSVGTAVRSTVGEVGFVTESGPRVGRCVGGGGHDTHVAVGSGPLGGRSPDGFELIETTISTTYVVLVIVEGRSPSRSFEFVTIERDVGSMAATGGRRPLRCGSSAEDARRAGSAGTRSISRRRPVGHRPGDDRWRGERVRGECDGHVTIVATHPCAEEEGQPCEFAAGSVRGGVDEPRVRVDSEEPPVDIGRIRRLIRRRCAIRATLEGPRAGRGRR